MKQRTVRGLRDIAVPLTFGAMHLGGVLARNLDQHSAVVVEVMLGDPYVEFSARGST